ncbi:MAG: hypothetical protein H6747_06025 [Deltaproteobacteria bacterium]|nr:hypothetical protein [Deltaproteobacteria bacterium]
MRALGAALEAEIGPSSVVRGDRLAGPADAFVAFARDARSAAAVCRVAAASGARIAAWHGFAERLPHGADVILALGTLRSAEIVLDASGLPASIRVGGGLTLGEAEAALRRAGATLGGLAGVDASLPVGSWLRPEGLSWPVGGPTMRPRRVLGMRRGGDFVESRRWHEIGGFFGIVEAELVVAGPTMGHRQAAWRFPDLAAGLAALAPLSDADPEAELDAIAEESLDRAALWLPCTAESERWTSALTSVFPRTAAWLDAWRQGARRGGVVVAQIYDEPGVAAVRMASLDHQARGLGGHAVSDADAADLVGLLPAEARFADAAAARRGETIWRDAGIASASATLAMATDGTLPWWSAYRARGPSALAWKAIHVAETQQQSRPPDAVGAPARVGACAQQLAGRIRQGGTDREVPAIAEARGPLLWTTATTPWRQVRRFLERHDAEAPLADEATDTLPLHTIVAAWASLGVDAPSARLPLGLRGGSATLGPWLDGLGLVWSDGRVTSASIAGPRALDERLDAVATGAAHAWTLRWRRPADHAHADWMWRGEVEVASRLDALVPRAIGLERLLLRRDDDATEVRLRLRGRRTTVRRTLDRLQRAMPGLRPALGPWPSLDRVTLRWRIWPMDASLPRSFAALVGVGDGAWWLATEEAG